jgi:hypothetical protein
MGKLQMIAWAPRSDPSKLPLLAVLCPANQKTDRQSYMTWLGYRVQAMIDSSPDPRQAVTSLQEEFYRTGLVRETGNCPTEEAGDTLVAQNPSVKEKVDNLMGLKPWPTRTPAVDSLAARNALAAEKSSPMDGLLNWATWMGQAP